MRIVLIDATSDSLTVSWPETSGSARRRYVLEYRKAATAVSGGGGSDDVFERLSDKLTTTQARKRNLEDPEGNGFVFRAGAVLNDDDEVSRWVTHPDPFRLLSEDEEKRRMAAPTVSVAGTNEALAVSWSNKNIKPAGSATTTTASTSARYELQMRENRAGEEWKTVAAAVFGTEAKKKNLKSKHGYQFRVRPAASDDAATADARIPFSAPSEPCVALGLSDGLRRVFQSLDNGTLLKSAKEGPIPLADALGGKEFVLLYASAHWCGPCRQFTPSLSGWYTSLGANKTAEVVFLSADHDVRGFADYYGQMPWLAVDFDDDAREQLMGFMSVSGIPRLAVIDARTGRIIEDNAVGKSLDMKRWRSLAASKK